MPGGYVPHSVLLGGGQGGGVVRCGRRARPGGGGVLYMPLTVGVGCCIS